MATDNLLTTFNRFRTHTDSLSGVNLSTGLNGANFATISSIASVVQKYRNDGSICQIINNAFGAILKANEYITAIQNLYGQLQNILTIPTQISSRINELRTLIESQIEEDLIAFASAQIDALRLSVASTISSLIGNDCIAEVLTVVGSQELKNVIANRGRNLF